MPEYYVHILNWGPIDAADAEEAAKDFHREINTGNLILPVYTVTKDSGFLQPHDNPFQKNFDSELWWEEENEE